MKYLVEATISVKRTAIFWIESLEDSSTGRDCSNNDLSFLNVDKGTIVFNTRYSPDKTLTNNHPMPQSLGLGQKEQKRIISRRWTRINGRKKAQKTQKKKGHKESIIL